MNLRLLRLAILVVSLLTALVGVAALLAWFLLDTDRLKEQLETRIAKTLEMDVRIGQPLGFSLIRGASVTLADIELSRQGHLVARAEGARVRIALFSLLTGRVRALELHLRRPEFWIERISPGVFNVSASNREPGALDEMRLRRLRVSDARLSYLDRASGLEWLFEHCSLDLRDLHRSGGVQDQARARLAAVGELACESLNQGPFAISQLAVEIRSDNGVFDFVVVDGVSFGGRVSARLLVDLSSTPKELSLNSRLSQFEVGAFMTLLNPEQDTSGKIDLELVLNARGGTWQEVRSSAAGMMSMSAGELVINGFDLDDELDSYAATQRFNLIDVGAVLLAGPVGLVASRGYSFTGLLEGRGGSTRIIQMVSRWTVEEGIAQAQDVAFSTPMNRLALDGGLDFAQYRFRDLQVAVIDSDGCALIEQEVSGPFHQPEVKRPNVLVTLVGPLLDLVQRGVRTLSNRDCKVFYSGSIPHP